MQTRIKKMKYVNGSVNSDEYKNFVWGRGRVEKECQRDLKRDTFQEDIHALAHCKKRLSIFQSPGRAVTDQTLPVRDYLNFSRP